MWFFGGRESFFVLFCFWCSSPQPARLQPWIYWTSKLIESIYCISMLNWCHIFLKTTHWVYIYIYIHDLLDILYVCTDFFKQYIYTICCFCQYIYICICIYYIQSTCCIYIYILFSYVICISYLFLWLIYIHDLIAHSIHILNTSACEYIYIYIHVCMCVCITLVKGQQ